MSMLIIRHGYAGKRKHWKGQDRIRPLTSYGRQQADAWVTLVEDRPIDAILSSPARRCMETVMPIAFDRGLSLTVTDDLSTDASLEVAQALVAAHDGQHVVLCTHREVLEQLLPAAAAEGAKFKGGMKWPKGGGWDLTIEGGQIVGGVRLAPPNGNGKDNHKG